MRSTAVLFCVFLLCFCASSHAADKTVEFEAGVGYEYNDNVVYSEIATNEGADYITSGFLGASFSPFSSNAFSVKVGGYLNFSDYQKRPEFNTHGQSVDLTLMYNPLGLNYFYLIFGSASYTIGDQTDSSSKTSSLQYVTDISGTSHFWTTIFFDRIDEAYSDPSYEPLGGPSTTIGIKQSLFDHFYLLAKSSDCKAKEDDLTYSETSSTIGAEEVPALWFDLSCGVTASRTQYKEAWFFFPLKKREDNAVSCFLSFSRHITADLSLIIEYAYMNNRCNLSVDETRQGYASYSQNGCSVSLDFKI